jgi:predicted transcriptional regulator
MKKDKAIQVLNEMPKEFDIELLIERLLFIEKVEEGLEQIKEGKVVSHESVKNISQKW